MEEFEGSLCVRAKESYDKKDRKCWTIIILYALLRHCLESQQTGKAVVTSNITTEWKTYRQLLVNKSEDNMKLQLKEFASNDMLKTLFPNLSKLATISLSICVVTASVERSFSQMKLIKTHLRSILNDKNLLSTENCYRIPS